MHCPSHRGQSTSRCTAEGNGGSACSSKLAGIEAGAVTSGIDPLRDKILAEAAQREAIIQRLERLGDVAALADLALHLVRADTYRRLGRINPRTTRTAKLANRVAKAHAQGVDIAALQERFSISRATVYRLLNVSRIGKPNAP
ncbi:helix-turn-helix domain-containing protein [Marilutibacter maris]|uniref:helix-turn-helix domain-containing protein n=1 Tax=Marilutibacter maris TaxID=1605891 RepID=UPI000DA7BB57